MKLQIEHLAPYLPYELEIQRKGTGYTMIVLENGNIKTLESEYDWFPFSDIKPILRPLSDMTYEELQERLLFKEDVFSVKSAVWLFSKHFDVFGLIPEGLAVDSSILYGKS